MIQSASLLGRRCTGFSLKGTVPPRRLTRWLSVSAQLSSSAAFPGSLRPPIARSRGFRPLQVLPGSPNTDEALHRHFACAYRLAYAGKPAGDSDSPPEVTSLLFRTVPSANTLVRRVNENAFASIVQARPCPAFGRPFIFGVAPIDYGPVRLFMPFGFRLTTDTLPSEENFSSASEALPPLLDTVILIRSPEGLEPS